MAYFTYDHDHTNRHHSVSKWADSVGPVVGKCLALGLCVALIPLAILALPFTLFTGKDMKSGEYWN